MYFAMILFTLLGSSGFALNLAHNFTAAHAKRPIYTVKGARPPTDIFQVAYWDPDDHISQDDAQKFANKGRRFNCLFPLSDADAGKAWPDPYMRTPKSASSLFKGTLEAELALWGWREYPHFPEVCNWGSPLGGANIKRALEALGLNAYSKADGGDNVCYSVHHAIRGLNNEKGQLLSSYQQAYTVNGKQYHRTGATYQFGINHVGGAIFGRALSAPMNTAMGYWRDVGPRPTLEMLPLLRHGSDIMAAYWLRSNPDLKSLKYYFALGIENVETLRLLATILQEKGIHEMPVWPGLTLAATEGADWMGEALVGSPIGAMIGFILLQHKEVLGLKHVTEIVIFKNDDVPGGGNVAGDPDPYDEDDDDDYDMDEDVVIHLLFKIADVPPPKDEDMPDDGGDNQRRMAIKKGEFVKREYTVGKNMRVHEFRMW